jgi:hypothetical protein
MLESTTIYRQGRYRLVEKYQKSQVAKWEYPQVVI